MLGLDAKAARATWTVLLILLLVELAWLARGAIMAFVVALLLSYLIAPVVDLVKRIAPPNWPHKVVVTIVFLALMGSLGTALFLVSSRIVQEAAELAQRIPVLIEKGGGILSGPLPAVLEPYRDQLRHFVEQQVREAAPLLGRVGTGLLSGLDNVLYVVLVPILSFLCLLEAPSVRSRLLEFFDHEGRRSMADNILADVHLLLGSYMRSMFLLSSATFTAYALYFEIARVPYGLLLAGTAALLEFIPVVGPLTGMVIGLVVAGFSGYEYWGWMIVFFLLYRVFQDYVLQPWLLSSGVELHPILVLFGALAGEKIAGVPGLLLSVPVMAILRILYRRIQHRQLA